MDITIINSDNIAFLEEFIKNNRSTSFRYYDNRPISCIQNHILTIVGMLNNIPIGYGHLDFEKYIWLGICVLENYQGKGYGKIIMNYLINFATQNNINNIRLSVDLDNDKAINLYKKYKFKVAEKNNKYIIMNLDLHDIIKLPVSIGEAIDKLTILDIKMDMIKDARKYDVEKEYKALFEELNVVISKYEFYYNILKDINLNIWLMQDDFRYSDNDNIQTQLCKKIITENDRRFRVKKKINECANSYLKEQKGYKLNEAFVLTHLGLGDNITAIGMVRYLSTCFDKIYVVCKQRNIANMKAIYSDDCNIELYPVNDDHLNISPQITKDKTVFTCGVHNARKKIYDIPVSFYEDVNIDFKYFWEYFYVPRTIKAQELYCYLKDINYIFLHNTSSTGTVFQIDFVEKKLNLDRNKTLFINPCYNIYEKQHPFYLLADKFINHLLIDYSDTIINAQYIILSDSSFMSLSMNLEIKTNQVFYCARGKSDYSYLYKPQFIFNKNIKRQVFKNLNLI